ncbi:ATP-binding protein [Microbacterium album]|uniref:AAA+ ATPase domain-containing protein n=1 Tax=Microbacterium album TaxID=2053191 RepID=A0A917MN35_9MICO|nr:ATP-binding protein [Microbacterium album]GGH50470.1 hypothetical protein GCM10010921_29250 [Microbacterium album]
MQLNPYTPSDRPRVFVGREQERTRLRDRLARVIAYGEMMGPLTIVTGPRGLGKTSLLRDVADRAASDGFVVAWSAGIKQQPFLTDVVDRVTRALQRADVGPRDSRSKRRIEELGLEVNLGIAKVSAKLGTAPGADERDRPAPALLGPLEDFLHETSTMIRQRGGAGLLVVIDELHAPLESRSAREYAPDQRAQTDAAVLLNVVQNMGAERERYPVAVVGAGLPQTKELLTRAATFGERVDEMVLSGLGPEASAAVLTEPARQLGVTWEADALEAAVAGAGGYPQALQIVGSAAWEAARPENGDAISLAHVAAGRAAAQAAMDSLFLSRWRVASETERAFLRAMASLPGASVRRGAIAAQLGVPTESLGVTRQSLINKGLIEAPAHGRLRFTIPGFSEFVRTQSGDVRRP